jgi:hypothetical protein
MPQVRGKGPKFFNLMNINQKISAKNQIKKLLHLNKGVGLIQYISKTHSAKFYQLILNYKA